MSTPGHVRLAHAQKKLLVAILIQNPEVYLEFRLQLAASGFEENVYQLVMHVVAQFYDSAHTLPSEALLSTEIQAFTESNPDTLSDEEYDELSEFVAYAFDPATFGDTPPTSEQMTKFAFKAAASHLYYSHYQSVQRQLEQLVDLSELDSIFKQARVVSEQISLSQQQSGPNFLFEDAWDKIDHGKIVSTGVPFLDEFMNGGAKQGEGYLIMAPYGTCKTTLAAMLGDAAAKASYLDASNEVLTAEDNRLELSFAITYEAPKHEMQHRFISTAAQISRYRLEAMASSRQGLDFFSNDAAHPLPYEQKRFAALIASGNFVPERQRIDAVIPYLNKHLVCLDLSGSDSKHPGAGTGGVDEMVRRIRQEVRNRGGEDKVKIRMITIDYLGIAADRDITPMAGGKKRPDDAKLYQETMQKIVTDICKPFKCHAWVFHQLNGVANKSSRTGVKLYDHTDAKGSKSVAENADFSLVINPPNGNNMCTISCTKRRRERPIEPRIILIEGEFNTVVKPVGFRLDKHNRIIDEATAASLGVASVNLGQHLSDAAEDTGDATASDPSAPFDDDEAGAISPVGDSSII